MKKQHVKSLAVRLLIFTKRKKKSVYAERFSYMGLERWDSG